MESAVHQKALSVQAENEHEKSDLESFPVGAYY